MPDLMTRFIGKLIDDGKSDKEILEALVKREGPLVLRQHQY